MADPWLVPVRALRRVLGSSHHEHRCGTLGHLSVADTVVGPDTLVDAEVTVSAIDGGVEVSGRVSAPFLGRCRRCGQALSGELVAQVREVYRPRSTRQRNAEEDEETYELGPDHLDLAPLARDAVLLDLPIAPLCEPECLGLCDRCGADLNTDRCACGHERVDDRWAALDVLREPPGAAPTSPRS
ncbi:MAG: DUF177 domain-containing protein [Actinomycetota bacterium]|nr:DUF177 domain-containing protein [Actinomycetota bacterium]